MAGRPRRASDADIFDAVARTVTAHGPDGATLATIAGQTGLTASALTHRFGSKHALLVAFAEHAADSAHKVFDSARRRYDDPAEAAVESLLGLMAHLTDRASVANNLAFLQRDLTDPQLAAAAARTSAEIRRGLTELLTQAADRFTGSAELLADDLYTTAAGAQMTWAIDGNGELTDWIRQRLDRVLARHEHPTGNVPRSTKRD